jgi:hypothetical protein
MTLQATQQISKPRLTATYTAVAATDTITADAQAVLILHVKNAGGSTDNITITDPGSSPGGNPATSYATSVANGAEGFIPLSPQLANSSGIITVAHSFTTTVTCAVLRND